MNNIIIADDFKFDDPIEELTFNTFGIRNLFPIQRFVIANILDSLELNDSENTNDTSSEPKNQIVLLPTGAGKSICFQVPALVLPHPTLIIYPLLALMTDQQRRMEENNINCVVFRGGQSQEERNENFNKLKNGAKVIIANPEVLENKNLIKELKQIGISHIAIDEAHCVSEWGDTFRPSYLSLGNVIKEINAPIVTAFTATASPEVLKRITEVLDAVGMGRKSHKMPYQLSGGEQQRIAIARSLLNEPHVIIADEPTGNLDNETADGIMQLLTRINKEKGTAIVMVTHNRQIFEKYPGRVMVCKDEVCQEQMADEPIDLDITI